MKNIPVSELGKSPTKNNKTATIVTKTKRIIDMMNWYFGATSAPMYTNKAPKINIEIISKISKCSIEKLRKKSTNFGGFVSQFLFSADREFGFSLEHYGHLQAHWEYPVKFFAKRPRCA